MTRPAPTPYWRVIERERISTAAQLVTRLQSEGISATQATVTRDLKSSAPSRCVTRTAFDASWPPPRRRSRTPLGPPASDDGEWVVSVESREPRGRSNTPGLRARRGVGA